MAPKKVSKKLSAKEVEAEKRARASARASAKLSVLDLPPAKPNPIVFFDIKIGGEDAGRLIMELFAHITPKTADNFRCLCTGEKGMGKQGKNLSFRKSRFHRVIPGLYAQGGDFIHENGTGGESIYDGQPFEDENFHKSNAVVGSLAMCNSGHPNSNESQFFFNLAPNPDLDGVHVVFGQVKEESMGVLKAIEAVGSWTGRLHQTVKIRRCGWLNKPTEEELRKMAEEAAEEAAKKLLAEEEAAKLAAEQAAAPPPRPAAKKKWSKPDMQLSPKREDSPWRRQERREKRVYAL